MIRDNLLKEVFAEYEMLKLQVKKLQTQLAEVQNSSAYKSASIWVSKTVFVPH